MSWIKSLKVIAIMLVLMLGLSLSTACLAVDAPDITKPSTDTIIPESTAEPSTEAPATSAPTEEATDVPTRPAIDIHKDILFIGNSLTEGMRLCASTENQFICEVGVSLDGLNVSAMQDMRFEVVVINMGTNELGAYTEEHFKESYELLIQKIREVKPDARIVCCSIPPIAANHNYPSQYNTENARLYTTYIQEVAATCHVEFLDNAEFFGPELNADWTGDGLHYTADIYAAWYDFLIHQL